MLKLRKVNINSSDQNGEKSLKTILKIQFGNWKTITFAKEVDKSANS